MKYATELKASFARMYLDRSTIESEATSLAARFPEEMKADRDSGILGYRLTVYFNIRDFLGADHGEAILCLDIRDPDSDKLTAARRREMH